MNKLELKRQIFDLFDRARILFNDYYNGKEEYTEDDLYEIMFLMLKIKENVNHIEDEIREEIY